jgi:citrate lyase subunit beta/citryl-CoA lyase
VKPYRSMLFVPGHKPSWVPKGIAAGADALILDLEDAVPVQDKPEARRAVARSIAEVAAQGGDRPGLWVRPNSWESGLAGLDLEEIVVDGLDGLFLPKVYGVLEVIRFDTLLTHFELRSGLPEGSVELIVSLETAQSMAACEEIATASPRVASLLGATARDADTARALGYRYTPEGMETLYLRSRVVLACRAAGLDHPLCGLWQDINDLEGLTPFAQQNAQLGYRGQVLIHPSHVGPVNAVFTPSEDEVAFYRGMIEAFERGEAAGDAAVDYEGQHIDYAHVKTAREVVALADGVRRA